MMLLQKLEKKGLIRPPPWLSMNTAYLTTMGSFAYGVSSDTSDYDVYGFAIPPKDVIFPHLAGEIIGFGKKKKPFGQYQKHHILVKDELGGKGREYDLKIYNIVKYFQLIMENNPDVIDSLFTEQNCVLHITEVGTMVRENRHMFLTKKSWHTFKGYAFSQLHKMTTKNPKGKRVELREKFGFDVKFAYHIVRLLSEVEQILAEGDLDLREKGRREHMKAIRRGEVSETEIRSWASAKEHQLEDLYHKSTLRHSPDEPKIRQLLLDCLEHHYGSLEKCIVNPDEAVQALKEIQEVLEKHKGLLG